LKTHTREPHQTSDTHTICARSLQLNLGIIAACASFLKPLVGRLLKINSSVGYSYPSNPYARSGRTPMGAETIGSKYPNRRRGDRSHQDLDEFELHTKNHDNQVVTRVHAASPVGASQDYSSAEAVDAVPSDSNSEEIILQKQDSGQGKGRGIVMTRDVTVRYTNK
jgi:hypothetical protein